MYCSKCGYEIKDGVTFCASCGAKMGSQQQNSSDQDLYGYNQALSPEVAAAERQSVASLVMGIIGLITCFVAFLCFEIFSAVATSGLRIFSIVTSIAGIILGSLAISKGNKARSALNDEYHNFWIALAGVITGTIGLVISIIFTIAYFSIIMSIFTV